MSELMLVKWRAGWQLRLGELPLRENKASELWDSQAPGGRSVGHLWAG